MTGLSYLLDDAWQTTVCASCSRAPSRCCEPSCDARAAIAIVDGEHVQHARCLYHVQGEVLVSQPINDVQLRRRTGTP